MRRLLPLVLLLAACESVPVPAPAADEAGVIGIQVRVAERATDAATRPHRVFLVRLKDGEAPGRARGPVLVTNYARAGFVYLLNAPAGRYVAVAASSRRDGKEMFTFFPEDGIAKTEAVLAPGGRAFLGLVRMETRPGGFEKADAAQQHYLKLVRPFPESPSVVQAIFKRNLVQLGHRLECDRGDERTSRFEAAARDALADAGWGERLR